MKDKRFLILGVALVLFAVVAGMAFAGGWIDGVHWFILDNTNQNATTSLSSGHFLQVNNSNDYTVRVSYRMYSGEAAGNVVDLAPGETKNIRVSATASVSRVVRLR